MIKHLFDKCAGHVYCFILYISKCVTLINVKHVLQYTHALSFFPFRFMSSLHPSEQQDLVAVVGNGLSRTLV